MSDYFASSTFSLVLSWLLVAPTISSLIVPAAGSLFMKFDGVPRLFSVWIALCSIFLSPFLYILLQISVGLSFPVQSIGSLLSTLVLCFYIPIVFGLLCAIGIGLPLLIVLAIAGLNTPRRVTRLLGAAVAAPLAMLLSTHLYFLVLPYAAYSTHWLKASDLIAATNGPSEYFYEYVLEPILPLAEQEIVGESARIPLTSKERLRMHVARTYLGEEKFLFYLRKTYPNTTIVEPE